VPLEQYYTNVQNEKTLEDPLLHPWAFTSQHANKTEQIPVLHRELPRILKGLQLGYIYYEYNPPSICYH